MSSHRYAHQDVIRTFALTREEPLFVADLVRFFQELVNYRPEQLLRVTGTTAIRGREGAPAVVHGIRGKV